MSGLRYLFTHTIKNRIKQLATHPGQLILYLVFAAILVLTLVGGALQTQEPGKTFGSLSEVTAMAYVLYLFVFVSICLRGLSSGASFYSMADVNLLFATPISPRTILFYGLFKQLGTSLLVGLFLLFQYGWLSNVYNLSLGGLGVILLGYAVTVFAAQLTSMVIYSFTSGSDGAQRVVRTVLYLMIAAVVAAVAYPLLADQSDLLGTAVSAINGPVPSLFPVAGWLGAMVSGAFSGQLLPCLGGLIATGVFIAALVILLLKSRADYYEDVLQAPEVSFSAITAQKEGKMAEALPRNIKVGKTGLKRGRGPSAFYYKHLLENRRSRVFLFDMTSLIFLTISVVFGFFLREEGLLPILIFSAYMQFFSTVTGRWARELSLPFVYLAPGSPFRKLVMICGETMLKTAAQGVLLFAIIGVIQQAAVWDIAACMIAYFTFGLLFIAGNFLVERLCGTLVNKVVVITLYFLVIIVLCLPGILLGVFAAMLLPAPVMLMTGVLLSAGWNLGVSALIAYLCRNILTYAELNNK